MGNQEKSEEITLEIASKIKEKLYSNIEKDRSKQLIETLLALRLSLLKGKIEHRVSALKTIIEIDILKAKEEENYDSLNKMLEFKDHSLTTSLFSLISMFSSCEAGISYITGDFMKPGLILTVFQALKDFNFYK